MKIKNKLNLKVKRPMNTKNIKPVKSPVIKKTSPVKEKPDLVVIYVANLPYKLKERDVGYLFSKELKVKFVKMIVDPKTEKRVGIAFVSVYKNEKIESVIKEMNGHILDGRTLKVSLAMTKEKTRVTKLEKTLKQRSIEREANQSHNRSKRKSIPKKRF